MQFRPQTMIDKVQMLPNSRLVGSTNRSLLFDVDGVKVTMIWTDGVVLSVHPDAAEAKAWKLMGLDQVGIYQEVADWLQAVVIASSD